MKLKDKINKIKSSNTELTIGLEGDKEIVRESWEQHIWTTKENKLKENVGHNLKNLLSITKDLAFGFLSHWRWGRSEYNRIAFFWVSVIKEKIDIIAYLLE